MKKSSNSILKSAISESFSKAAITYDEHAALQVEIASRLLSRLDFIKINPKYILDLGCGTGYSLKNLSSIYQGSEIIGLDLAPGMLQYASAKNPESLFLCNDAEILALKSNSIDLIFSSCTMQWSQDLDKLLKEVYRVLKPGGLFLFSTFGPDTLKELSESWRAVDSYDHVNNFLDMHIIGDLLLQNKYSLPVVDQEYFTLTYSNILNLLKELKSIGANSIIGSNKQKGLYGKDAIKNLEKYYKDNFAIKENESNILPATYEVIYGIAWKEVASVESISNITVM